MRKIIFTILTCASFMTAPTFAGHHARSGHGYRKCCTSCKTVTNCCAFAAIGIIAIILLSETNRGGNPGNTPYSS